MNKNNLLKKNDYVGIKSNMRMQYPERRVI